MYNIYGLLLDVLPRPAANAVCALWYALLIILILYFSFEPRAEFNYLNV